MKTVTIEFTSAVILLFLAFWSQSGWYRVDCALGQKPACDLIAAEYAAAAAKGRLP